MVREKLAAAAVAKEAVDALQLCASEFVTNAIGHADGAHEFRITCTDGVARVGVEDTSAAAPTLPHIGPTVGGRGLVIVAASADRWGWTHSRTGRSYGSKSTTSAAADWPRVPT